MGVYSLERDLIPDFEEREEHEGWNINDLFQRLNARPIPPPGTQVADEVIK